MQTAIHNRKFQHRGRGIVYTLHCEGEKVKILWNNRAGIECSIVRDKKEVDRNFRNRIWIEVKNHCAV